MKQTKGTAIARFSWILIHTVISHAFNKQSEDAHGELYNDIYWKSDIAPTLYGTSDLNASDYRQRYLDTSSCFNSDIIFFL